MLLLRHGTFNLSFQLYLIDGVRVFKCWPIGVLRLYTSQIYRLSWEHRYLNSNYFFAHHLKSK